MLITDYRFTDYYQQYVTFEADDLTEKCKESIDVNMDDCYALCSSWVNDDGELMFNVLAIGEDWSTCTKGLDNPEMLAQFTLDDVRECTARIAVGDYAMISKNSPFIQKMDENTDDELMRLRQDGRFDDIRDYQYPDIVEVLYVYEGQLLTCAMRMKEIQGPFVIGEITDLPDQDTDINFGEMTYTLPCIGPDGFGLVRLCGDDSMNSEEADVLQDVIDELTSAGIDFDGIHIKS